MVYSVVIFAAIASLHWTSAAPTPSPWFQPRDSPIHALFKRDNGTTPDPNNPNFASNYPNPSSTPNTANLPSAWTTKLASLTLPNVSVSTQNNGYPTYPGGESGTDANICSFTYQCNMTTDLITPPTGIFAVSFDDGPTDVSPGLYDFLQQNNVSNRATHFMIGGNILGLPLTTQEAFHRGGHIAVHTWSHPYMTTLSNEAVLAELGWTMQIIHDLTGGRVPMFWRPPYGDVDNRVRAIAKGVFGLETVLWDQDSADWAIGTSPQYTLPGVEAQMKTWLTGSKSPGLLLLEHELNNNTVTNFEVSFPLIAQNNWQMLAVPDAFNMSWYQNSVGDNSTVISMSVGDAAPSMTSSTTSLSMSTASSMSMTTSSASVTPSAGQSTGVANVASPSATAKGAAGRSAELGGVRSALGWGAVCVGTLAVMLL